MLAAPGSRLSGSKLPRSGSPASARRPAWCWSVRVRPVELVRAAVGASARSRRLPERQQRVSGCRRSDSATRDRRVRRATRAHGRPPASTRPAGPPRLRRLSRRVTPCPVGRCRVAVVATSVLAGAAALAAAALGRAQLARLGLGGGLEPARRDRPSSLVRRGAMLDRRALARVAPDVEARCRRARRRRRWRSRARWCR